MPGCWEGPLKGRVPQAGSPHKGQVPPNSTRSPWGSLGQKGLVGVTQGQRGGSSREPMACPQPHLGVCRCGTPTRTQHLPQCQHGDQNWALAEAGHQPGHQPGHQTGHQPALCPSPGGPHEGPAWDPQPRVGAWGTRLGGACSRDRSVTSTDRVGQDVRSGTGYELPVPCPSAACWPPGTGGTSPAMPPGARGPGGVAALGGVEISSAPLRKRNHVLAPQNVPA